jgi:hypothetical protein
MQNASGKGWDLRSKPWDLGFAGVPGAPPGRRGFALMAGTRAVHRAVGDDQGDACQVTHGKDLAQDDQSGSGGGGRAVNAACGWVDAQS